MTVVQRGLRHDGRGVVLEDDRIVAEVDYTVAALDANTMAVSSPDQPPASVGPGVFGVLNSDKACELDHVLGRRVTVRLAGGESFSASVTKILDPNRYLIVEL